MNKNFNTKDIFVKSVQIVLIAIIIVLALFNCSAKSQTSTIAKSEITDGFMPTFKKIEKNQAVLDDMAKAFSKVESNNNRFAHNKKENSAGILAIRPIMVDEANRLLKMHDGISFDYFEYDDRFDKSYSELIFSVIMVHKNPNMDIVRACYVWNKFGGEKYIKKITAAYNAVKKQKNGKH